ncbi:MAG TPA: pitrilysin family protein [Labilithrix sp.]|nr:pitrilysin family protein [Labilithrix sp.]
MRLSLRGPALVLALVATSACGGDPPPVPVAPTPVVAPLPPPVVAAPVETPDAVFRQQAPAADGKITFVAPKVVEATLKNGLRVLIVERHELPVVGLRLVVGAGAGDLEGARPGALSFLGGMIEQGTKKRTALQISDDFEAIGAQHGAWFDWDSGGVSVKVLKDKLDAALDLMSDVALNPTFPDAEIERLRARRIAGIQSEKSSPGTIAQNSVGPVIFGRAHPYGHSLSGEESDAKKLTRAELVSAYGRLFVPKNAAIVVAGDITKDSLLPKLEATFGTWKSVGAAISHKGPKTPAKAAADKRVVLVDKAGAQSQIQVVRPGVPFATKDRDSLVVMNAILGGMFSSRINMNLREKNAYTYGARSYFAMRHGAGPFLAGASVFAEKTVPAIKEVFTEIEGLRRDGPTDEELALAKESIRLAMPGRFETVGDVASAVADLVVYDLPLDDFEKKLGRIDAVTAADVKRVAVEQLKSDTMTVVVVGGKATLAPQLESLGLGAFEERDAYGNPVPTGAGLPKTDAKASAPKK